MKKILFAAFVAVTLVLALTYIISCLTPYVGPVKFWPLTFFALGFPYVALAIITLAVTLLFVKKIMAMFLMLVLFAGYKNLTSTFAINAFTKTLPYKPASSLRILTWNVRGFDNPSTSLDTIRSVRKKMFDYISKVNPDVLCLQEFAQHDIKGTFSNTQTLKNMGYVYMYKTNEIRYKFSYGIVLAGTAIFSKIPIISSGKEMLGDTTYPEYLAYIDILHQQKRIRVFATHFKSINLFASLANNENRVTLYGDSNFVYLSSKPKKLIAFAQAHEKEAVIAKRFINKSPYPVIACADMNSVPTSHPYHTMSAGLNDAFVLRGWGLGGTMLDFPKTLRIDYLLVDKRLSVTNFAINKLDLSDHFPQFIDVNVGL